MQETVYRYQISAVKIWLAIGFFAACAAVLFHEAYTNTDDLLIDGIFHLSPEQASIFDAVIGILAILFVLRGAYIVLRGGLKPRRIIIRKDEVSLPSLGKEHIVPLALITEVSVTAAHRQPFLTIKWRGKPAVIQIARDYMPDAGAFEELYAKLSAVAQSGKTRSS